MATGGYDFTTRGVDFQQPIQNFLGVRQMRQKNALMKQEQERFSKEEKIKVQKSISEILQDELSAVEYDDNYNPIPDSLESAKRRAYIRVKEIAPNQADMLFQKLDQLPPDQIGKGILEARAAKEGKALKEKAAGKGSETERAWERYNKNNPDKPVDFETYKNTIYNTPKDADVEVLRNRRITHLKALNQIRANNSIDQSTWDNASEEFKAVLAAVGAGPGKKFDEKTKARVEAALEGEIARLDKKLGTGKQDDPLGLR